VHKQINPTCEMARVSEEMRERCLDLLEVYVCEAEAEEIEYDRIYDKCVNTDSSSCTWGDDDANIYLALQERVLAELCEKHAGVVRGGGVHNCKLPVVQRVSA
jgi:hypothetical protein